MFNSTRLYVSTDLSSDMSTALFRAIQNYTPWPPAVERPPHNPKYCPTAPFANNRIYHHCQEQGPCTQTPTQSATKDVRNTKQRNENDHSADTNGTRTTGMNIRQDWHGNINVTTPRCNQRREELPFLGAGLTSDTSPCGTSPNSGSSHELKKLKQVENMGKAYNDESLKFKGARKEDFGSALLTFWRNLSLYRVYED